MNEQLLFYENVAPVSAARHAVPCVEAPAFIRRYPFVFSTSTDRKTLTLCIDKSYRLTGAMPAEGEDAAGSSTLQ